MGRGFAARFHKEEKAFEANENRRSNEIFVFPMVWQQLWEKIDLGSALGPLG